MTVITSLTPVILTSCYSVSVSGISHMASTPHSSNCDIALYDTRSHLESYISLAQHLDHSDTFHVDRRR